MIGWRSISLCLVSLSLCQLTVAEEPVGNLGEPERIQFSGQQTFDSEQLRNALTNDFDFLLASAADVERTELIRVLSGRLIDGYRQAGFAKPNVEVKCLDDHVQVQISEGPRFRRGTVTVIGPESVDGPALAAFVENPPNETAFDKHMRKVENESEQNQSSLGKWKRDEWANFHRDPQKYFQETIAAGLKNQGYFYPEFDCRLVTKNDKVVLEITVRDEGPAAVFETVTFRGLDHHTPKQIRDFLGFQTGQRVSQNQLTRWQQKLLDSYCFLEARLYVLPAIAKELPCELVVEVIEQPRGPYLGEELTEIDQAMIRHANWWKNWQQTDDDIVYEAEKSEATKDQDQNGFFATTARESVVASARDGILIDIEMPHEKENRPRWTIILEENCWELISWHRRSRVYLDSLPGNVQMSLGLGYKWNDEKQCWQHTLLGGYGITTKSPSKTEAANSPHRWFEFQYRLSHAIAAGRDDKDKPRREADELHYGAVENPARIDFATGRPIGFHAFVREAPEGAEPNVRIVPGEFQRRLKTIRQETQDFTTDSDHIPVTAWFAFVLEELTILDHLVGNFENRATLLFLRNLCRHDAFTHLEKYVRKCLDRQDSESTFSLPSPTNGSEIRLPGLNEMLFGMAKPISRGLFQVSNALFGQNTAPGRVGWNVALFCTGRFTEAGQNLAQLQKANDCGPLTCLYVAELFSLVKSPQEIEFAKAGLRRLDTEFLRRELDPVLSQNSLFLQLCDPVFTAIQDFSPQEIDELLSAIDSEVQRERCRTLFARIQSVPKDQPREQLIESILMVWESGFRELVEARLNGHRPNPQEIIQIDFEDRPLDE